MRDVPIGWRHAVTASHSRLHAEFLSCDFAHSTRNNFVTLRTSRRRAFGRPSQSRFAGRTSCASPAVRVNISRFSAMFLYRSSTPMPPTSPSAAGKTDRQLSRRHQRNPRRHVRRGRECAADRAVAAAIRVLTLILCGSSSAKPLVSRTRSSHDCAASSFANFGFKGTLES